MKTIAVYMGAAEGARPEYREAAVELGRQVAAAGLSIVYGGANVGLMKVIGESFVSCTGRTGSLIGVFPTGFKGRREVQNKNIEIEASYVDEMIHVANFGDRIAKMDAISDAAVIFPGGFGTMQEMFSYLVNQQIGVHEKPVYVLNICGYYDNMLAFIRDVIDNGFVKHAPEKLYVAGSVEELVTMLKK